VIPARAIALVLAVATGPGLARGPIRSIYFECQLATVAGPVPSTWASLAYDAARDEVFVVADGLVRVFNGAGMEVHRFGGDGNLGIVQHVAPLDDGSLVVLATTESARKLVRCDYRGEPIAEIALSGLPEALGGKVVPDSFVHRDGRLYLVESASMRIVVVDLDGTYRELYEVAELLKLDERVRNEGGFGSVAVDGKGNVVFTVPALSRAFVVSPSREVRSFGSRGSTPDTFNIIGAMAVDERGTFFVTDRLRSTVLVFDADFRFLGEFGRRGAGRASLFTPFAIVAGNGKIFVSQAAGKGVKVFRVTYEQ
jgi:hypothetical protein